MLIFQPMGSKTKTNGTLNVRFSRALSKLQVIAWNSDWFIALFDPIVIDRSCEVWYRFFDSHLKTALSRSLGISCSKLLKCVKLHLGLFLKKKKKKKKAATKKKKQKKVFCENFFMCVTNLLHPVGTSEIKFSLLTGTGVS